ncbi:MAG: PIN domain-containing protein [Chloroflexi bacterium]|nr:PIN domain-containing protein [Chloroflexota bacterium]
MRYLLDTTALIDFAKGREPASSRILGFSEGGDELAVCAINVAEFYAGVPPAQRGVWDEFFSTLTYWDVTAQAARHAGCLRFDFARKGRVLSTTDVIIAAVAQEKEAVIVTDNTKGLPDGRRASPVHFRLTTPGRCTTPPWSASSPGRPFSGARCASTSRR